MGKIDLNCDIGESFGTYTLGNDEEILDYVSSANIACGFHAGDPITMEKTVRLALDKGVSLGAHPGFPDLLGFGRRTMDISSDEVRAYMIYQIGALYGFVKALGGKLQHVKPHGALYNQAAKDYKLSKAIATAIYDIDNELILVGLANSKLIEAGNDVGLKTANEVFADRNYNKEGTLVSRKNENAVITNTHECVSRVLTMICENKIPVENEFIHVKAHTICLHGDNEKSLDFARNLREALSSNGISIKNIENIVR